MKVSEAFVYPFPIDAVYRMQTDRGCREEAAHESGALGYSVTVTDRVAGHLVEVEREMSSERIPDFVKKLIGETVHVRQVEEWGAAAGDGTRVGRVHVTIRHQPAHMHATLTLAPNGASTIATFEGELKVPIPIIGKKIEPEIARAVLGGFHVDQRVGVRWLEQHA